MLSLDKLLNRLTSSTCKRDRTVKHCETIVLKKQKKDVEKMTNLLSREPIAFNFTTEAQIELVMKIMVEREIFMSAENFDKLAWELLG